MGALGRMRQKCIGDGVAKDPTPDVVQILKSLVELGGGEPPTFAHANQGGRSLDMGDRRGADAVRLGVGAPSLFRSGLIDQELDQRAGIEVEAQRRSSETYSAALLPWPRSLAGLAGK